MIKAILCMDMLGNIGKDNDLLFHIPQDMKFFKEQTIGHTVLMGYNTYLSLGSKPLPNRNNIVLADKNKEIEEKKNLIVTDDLSKVIKEYENIYVIGGAFVYNEMISLDLVDEVLLTLVPTVRLDADTKVNIELLMQRYRKAEKIKDFIDEDLNKTISIWKLSK